MGKLKGIIDLKQNDVSLVFGGKRLLEHACIVVKETIKGAGIAYCIALPANENNDILGRVGQLNEAKKRGLNVITIGERCNIKNKKIEILITNYLSDQISMEFN